MGSAKYAALRKAITVAELDKVIIVLVATSFIPVFVHLIPGSSDIPAGAVWLPMFFAPFIAAFLFKVHVGLIAAVFAPMLNMFLTGKPLYTVTAMLTAELLIFVTISRFLAERYANFLGTSVAAYLIAKFTSSVFLGIMPYFALEESRFRSFLSSTEIAIPGLIVLFLINLFLIRYKEGEEEWLK